MGKGGARGGGCRRGTDEFAHGMTRQDDTGSCKRSVPLFENSGPGAAREPGQPMHSQSANFGKFKLNSLNLAPFLFLNPVQYSAKR